jgi:hypothetical protein
MNGAARLWVVLTGVLAAALVLNGQAQAAPTFSVGGVVWPFCSGPDFCFGETSTSAVSGGVGPRTDQVGSLRAIQDVLAIAGPGVLRAAATEDVVTTGGIASPFIAFDSATASFSFDDVVLSGPPGETTMVSFNIGVAGGLLTMAQDTMYSNAGAANLTEDSP